MSDELSSAKYANNNYATAGKENEIPGGKNIFNYGTNSNNESHSFNYSDYS